MHSTIPITIEDPEAQRLVIELASLTGKSVTETVVAALREKLEREMQRASRKGMAERLLAIGREAAALPVIDPRHPDDMLYDADGLPKE